MILQYVDIFLACMWKSEALDVAYEAYLWIFISIRFQFKIISAYVWLGRVVYVCVRVRAGVFRYSDTGL